MNFRQKVCKLFKVYNTCSLPFEYSCLRLRTYQQIRAERQSSHIPQSHFQMAGRKTRAPQSGQTAHTFTGPFVQPVMGPSHLRTGQGGCLINSLGMTFWWEQVMYYWEKNRKFHFFCSSSFAFVVTVIWRFWLHSNSNHDSFSKDSLDPLFCYLSCFCDSVWQLQHKRFLFLVPRKQWHFFRCVRMLAGKQHICYF